MVGCGQPRSVPTRLGNGVPAHTCTTGEDVSTLLEVLLVRKEQHVENQPPVQWIATVSFPKLAFQPP